MKKKKGLDTQINSTLCMEWVHSTASTDLLHCKYTQKIASYKFCFIIFVGWIFIYFFLLLLFSSFFSPCFTLMLHDLNIKAKLQEPYFYLIFNDSRIFSSFVYKFAMNVRRELREIMFNFVAHSQLTTTQLFSSPQLCPNEFEWVFELLRMHKKKYVWCMKRIQRCETEERRKKSCKIPDISHTITATADTTNFNI